jgi:hypothetical protein
MGISAAEWVFIRRFARSGEDTMKMLFFLECEYPGHRVQWSMWQ